MKSIEKLKKVFKNKNLLTKALTHRSWVNENTNKRGTNERLEFLGDAVLELIVSFELYKRFPEKEEGYLTALRANLVNTQNLSKVAEGLEIGDSLYLSKGEEEGGGRVNPSLLADTMEAIIGALFLDQGMDGAYEFVKENILKGIPQKLKEPLKDPKSMLQELVQAKGLLTPKYKVIKESGPDHSKTFVVEALVEGKAWGKGKGKNKSEAAKKAAEAALKKGRLVKLANQR